MLDQLTKLYVEITTACNLDCIMCIRRAWHEPVGTMPAEGSDNRLYFELRHGGRGQNPGPGLSHGTDPPNNWNSARTGSPWVISAR